MSVCFDFQFQDSFIEVTFWTSNLSTFLSSVSNVNTQRVRPTSKVHYTCMLLSLKWQTNQYESKRGKKATEKTQQIMMKILCKNISLVECHARRFYENVINENSLCFQQKLKFLSNYVL